MPGNDSIQGAMEYTGFFFCNCIQILGCRLRSDCDCDCAFSGTSIADCNHLDCRSFHSAIVDCDCDCGSQFRNRGSLQFGTPHFAKLASNGQKKCQIGKADETTRNTKACEHLKRIHPESSGKACASRDADSAVSFIYCTCYTRTSLFDVFRIMILCRMI